jgi:hypothetical protein
MEESRRLRNLCLILALILLGQRCLSQTTFELSTTAGVHYYYSPQNWGIATTGSITPSINFRDKAAIGIGIDFVSPYYDQYRFKGIYIEAKKMLYEDNHSLFVAVRYGFNDYISPSVGIIQHFDRVNLQFMFAYKYHKHQELIWIQGFEMRAGIIFKGK